MLQEVTLGKTAKVDHWDVIPPTSLIYDTRPEIIGNSGKSILAPFLADCRDCLYSAAKDLFYMLPVHLVHGNGAISPGVHGLVLRPRD